MAHNKVHQIFFSLDFRRAECLLKKGANPNYLLKEGATPFHLSVGIEADCAVEFVKLMLCYRADPNIRQVLFNMFGKV